MKKKLGAGEEELTAEGRGADEFGVGDCGVREDGAYV
jgi:hypothetical protein